MSPHYRPPGPQLDPPHSRPFVVRTYLLGRPHQRRCYPHSFSLGVSKSYYSPAVLFPALQRRDPYPPWRWLFAEAFTGIRGIVSLAAALAIPFHGGQWHACFPGRDLILFLAFSVILVTLVGQGLLLPAVIRALGLAHTGRLERHAEYDRRYKARQKGIEAAIERLDALAAERNLVEETIQPLRAYYANRLKLTKLGCEGDDGHRKCAEQRDDRALSGCC